MSDLKAIYILLVLCLISANEIVYKCKPEDSEKEVEIGDEVTLCIHTFELHKKVAFKIKVDEYSIISMKDAFSKIVLPKEEGTKEKESSGRRLESIRNLKYESIYDDKPDNKSTTNDTSPSKDPSTPDTSAPSEDPSTPSNQTEKEEQEEFITQIGEVKTKYSSVMLYIFYFIFS